MRTAAAIALTLASASAVFAQNSTSSSSTFTPPDSASQGCKTFLGTLNSNSAVSSCLNGMIAATSGFDSAGSTASVSDALSNLCSPSMASLCDPAVMRSALADFYSSCGTDMVPADGSHGNQDVINMYDTLYLVIPLKGAVCSKDSSSGKWCVDALKSGSSQKRDYLYERADNTTSQNVLSPDLSSYRTSGLPYLYLTPSTDMSILCGDCASKIIGSYVAFETVTPYALGVPNSQVLGGQVDLWNKIQQCSNGVANQILSNSTGNTGTYGAATNVRVGMTGIVVGFMSVVAATAALF